MKGFVPSRSLMRLLLAQREGAAGLPLPGQPADEAEERTSSDANVRNSSR
jgi:hypothetical protein